MAGAGKVAQLINAKKYKEVKQALAVTSPYGGASNAVTTALVTMRKVAAA